MSDFLSENDLILFKEEPKYTYLCHISDTCTWIDHVACSKHGMATVNFCEIINDEVINASDHPPILIGVNICLMLKTSSLKREYLNISSVPDGMKLEPLIDVNPKSHQDLLNLLLLIWPMGVRV